MLAEWYSSILSPLLRGLLVTIELAVVVLVVGTLCGMAGGVLSVWGGKIARSLFAAFIFLIRGVPLLVQAFAIYFILPLLGLTLSAFTTAAVALSVYATATITEIMRGGIEAVPKAQTDAAMAMGFSSVQTMRIVILPQAMLAILPPLITQFVILIKTTSIISLLGVTELTLAGRHVIERTLDGFEVMTMIWILYTVLCYPITVFGRKLEATLMARGVRSAATS